eukprot:403741_1
MIISLLIFTIYQLSLTSCNRLLQQVTIPQTVPSNTVWTPPILPFTIPGNQGSSPTGPHEIVCDLPDTDPNSCANIAKEIINAADGFKLTCELDRGCSNSRFNFVYQQTQIERIDTLRFAGQNGGKGSTIMVDCTENASQVYIEKLECPQYGSCANMEIILIGGASLKVVDCQRLDFCRRCYLYDCKYEVNGE